MLAPTALNTPYQDGAPILGLGYTELLEVAEYFAQLEDQNNGDPLAEFFPDENISAFKVKIQRRKTGVGITPLVNFGQPDVFVPDDSYDEKEVTPFPIRESALISQVTINHLRKFGTYNEVGAGLEEVARVMQRLVERRNNFIRVVRAKQMLGGVSYVDPRTKVGISLSANFHPANLVTLTTRDFFTNQTSDPIQILLRHKYELHALGKAEPTHIIMSKHMRFILENHPAVRANMGFYIPAPLTGGTTGGNNAPPQGFVGASLAAYQGYATMEGGKLTSIAGLKVVVVDTLYEDPANGFKVTEVWPPHKVAIVAKQRGSAIVGRTTHTLGENPDMKPGMYVRVSTRDLEPPQAPGGRLVQLGDNLIPHFIYPDWVRLIDVSTEAEVKRVVNTGLVTLTVPSFDHTQVQ